MSRDECVTTLCRVLMPKLGFNVTPAISTDGTLHMATDMFVVLILAIIYRQDLSTCMPKTFMELHHIDRSLLSCVPVLTGAHVFRCMPVRQ